MLRHSLRVAFCAIAAAALATAIGWVLVQPSMRGVRWRKLPRPPEPVVELIPDWDRAVFAKAESGDLYHCAEPPGACWDRREPVEHWIGLIEREPCSPGRSEFQSSATPFDSWTVCISGDYGPSFSCVWVTYLVDEKGDVWEWYDERRNCVGGAMVCMATPIISLLVGAGIGVYWSWRLARAHST